ncbi:hypothetical protein D3C78_479910 [compost metagenome]
MGKANQVLLVLGGHKAPGHALEQAIGQHQQAGKQQQRRGLASQDPLHAGTIDAGAALEAAVEARKQWTKQPLHASRQRILGRVMPLEQQGRQRRRKGE